MVRYGTDSCSSVVLFAPVWQLLHNGPTRLPMAEIIVSLGISQALGRLLAIPLGTAALFCAPRYTLFGDAN